MPSFALEVPQGIERRVQVIPYKGMELLGVLSEALAEHEADVAHYAFVPIARLACDHTVGNCPSTTQDERGGSHCSPTGKKLILFLSPEPQSIGGFREQIQHTPLDLGYQLS